MLRRMTPKTTLRTALLVLAIAPAVVAGCKKKDPTADALDAALQAAAADAAAAVAEADAAVAAVEADAAVDPALAAAPLDAGPATVVKTVTTAKTPSTASAAAAASANAAATEAICVKARAAVKRGSPAGPGLEAKCKAMGGTM